MPDQGVSRWRSGTTLGFYPSDELAALLAEFSGRFGISRSVLVRRAVRQGLAAAVAELAEGGVASTFAPDLGDVGVLVDEGTSGAGFGKGATSRTGLGASRPSRVLYREKSA